MAEPATARKSDTPPSEELKGELLAALKDYKPAPANERQDVLEGRYIVHPNQPLPAFDTQTAKAYHVTDEHIADRALYALICPPQMPARLKLIKQFKNGSHPNLITLAAGGIIDFSPSGEQRYALVYETPKGRTLSEIVAEQNGKILPEIFIVEHILGPLADVIGYFESIGMAHGRINPDNLFYGDSLTVGECISEPCGYSQDFHFEPVERMQALPAGKGECSVADDIYALGILAAWLRIGAGILAEPNRLLHLKRLLRDGTHYALVGNRELSDTIKDLLRGTLNDNTLERWTSTQLKAWLGGKRYNLLAPAISAAGSRPFVFEGAEHHNLRSLSQGIHQHWDKAPAPLRDGTLARWAELSARRKDTAEALNRTVKTLGARSEKQNNELVSRALAIIDPHAPMRLKELSVHIGGVGPQLAETMSTRNEPAFQRLNEMIDLGIASVWGEMQRKLYEDALPPDMSTSLWNLERARAQLRTPAYGFGIERALYELNPDLPCQSPLLAGHYVTTLPQLVTALDRVAAKAARGDEPIDRHIAAFICARLGISQEMTAKEFKAIPSLLRHKGLIALRLLHAAQQKAGHPKLPGLSLWAAASIAPVIDHLHSKSLKTQLAKGLKHIAPEGYLKPVADLVFHPEYLAADAQGFANAAHIYAGLNAQINDLKHPRKRAANAKEVGQGLSRVIAYLVFTLMLVFVTYGNT